MKLNPTTTQFLCDKCQNEVLYKDLEIISDNAKFCKECYENKGTLTPIQKSILIWMYNNQTWQHIDSGNLIYAYGKITNNKDFNIQSFRMDVQALIINKYIKTHTLNTFYSITSEGIKQVQSELNDQFICQCPQCGDLWRLDSTDDPIEMQAHLQENPKITTIEQICESCENEQMLNQVFWGDPDEDEDDYNTWDDVLIYGE